MFLKHTALVRVPKAQLHSPKTSTPSHKSRRIPPKSTEMEGKLIPRKLALARGGGGVHGQAREGRSEAAPRREQHLRLRRRGEPQLVVRRSPRHSIDAQDVWRLVLKQSIHEPQGRQCSFCGERRGAEGALNGVAHGGELRAAVAITAKSVASRP